MAGNPKVMLKRKRTLAADWEENSGPVLILLRERAVGQACICPLVSDCDESKGTAATLRRGF